ncbi:hypothetical protein D3C81_1687600 [compost metagenome]
MPALGVVKHFNVIEHILPGLLAIRIGFTSDPLAFEELEETLRHRVIMTIPASAHAGLEPVLPQKILPVIAAKLAPLVGMNQHFLFGSPSPHRHQ